MAELSDISDKRIKEYRRLVTLDEIEKEIPITSSSIATVYKARVSIEDILSGKDSRILVDAGPCSTHEEGPTYELARYFGELSKEVSDVIVLAYRTHFEKPRTGLGWPGLINDPNLNGIEDLNQGYRLARKILATISDMGVPCTTEYVDTNTPQLIGDFITWAAIGARTSYSQMHRRMVSSLSSPVGFKNDTDGNANVAINGVIVAREPGHTFPGTNRYGVACEIVGMGNPDTHIVLRGGSQGPNYSSEAIKQTQAKLAEKGFYPAVMIDCSHDNTLTGSKGSLKKDYTRQLEVADDVTRQIKDGNKGIVAIMMEVNHLPGNQEVPSNLKGFNRSKLKEGLSITDKCVSWEDTRAKIREIAHTLRRSKVYLGSSEYTA